MDAERGEDVGADVVLVGFMGCLFDDTAEDAVAEVGVRVALAGGEVEGLAEHVLDDLLGSGGRRGMEILGDEEGSEHRVEGFVAVPAAAVLEELRERDGGEAGIGVLVGEWVESENGEPGLIEAEFSLVDQLHDGCGGERLGDAGDAEE